MTQTTDLAAFHTAHALRTHLADLGVNDGAADAIVKETAAARHEWRVGQARDAALVGAHALLTALDLAVGDDDPGVYPDGAVQAAAAGLCLLEALGVGGHHGVSGDSTTRMRWAYSLGKGRKQASDGSAWSAAIAQAHDLYGLTVSASSGDRGAMVDFSFDTESPGLEPLRQVGIFLTDLPVEYLAHFLTLTREGLRRSLGLPGWHFTNGSGPTWTSPAANWADAVNAVERRIADEIREVASREETPYARDCRETVERRLAEIGEAASREAATSEVATTEAGAESSAPYSGPKVEVCRRRGVVPPTMVSLPEEEDPCA